MQLCSCIDWCKLVVFLFTQCQDPFVGDGVRCTLDSDGDGYPDQPLQSNSCSVSEGEELPRYCQQVRFSTVLTVSNNPSVITPSTSGFYVQHN